MFAATTTDLKQFMDLFLNKDAFDGYQLCEASITGGVTYMIDGHINKAFYEDEDERQAEERIYQNWGDVRPVAFQMIKGKTTPIAMKFVLCLSRQDIEKFTLKYNLPVAADQINGLYFNIRFEQGKLTFSSGTALSIFTLDKTVDLMWDELLTHQLSQLGISVENL